MYMYYSITIKGELLTEVELVETNKKGATLVEGIIETVLGK